jgi:hypothetical protein
MAEQSFVQNVNKLAENYATVEVAAELFDPTVTPVLQEIADLDLQSVTTDFKKGSFLGNRKIDIDLSNNKAGVAGAVDPLTIWLDADSTIYYDSAIAVFTDGTIINIAFVNPDAQPITISTAGDLTSQLNDHVAFNTKLVNTSITNDIGGNIGSLVRILDVIGSSSNLERLQVNVVAGSSPVEIAPVYYWARTTSALQTLANRAGDIIALGNDIDSIVSLSQRIGELITLQASLTELLAIEAALAPVITPVSDAITEITTVSTDITSVTAVGTNMASINAIAAEMVTILDAANQASAAAASASGASGSAATATTKAGIATTQAGIATTKANQILTLETQAQTLIPGELATAVYNAVGNKITFGIPQGTTGAKGDSFTVNSVGNYSEISLYDDQVKGFSFLAIDTGAIYFKLSATTADWSVGAPFGKGDTGLTGVTGNGISSVVFLSTDDVGGVPGASGAIDTYRITMTDATTSDFAVYNGLDSNVVDSVTNTTDTWSSSKIDTELTALNDWTPISASSTLKANTKYSVDFGASPLTLTLPLAPAVNGFVEFYKSAGASLDSIIARNGETIMGLAEDLTIDTEINSLKLIYNGTDWRLS